MVKTSSQQYFFKCLFEINFEITVLKIFFFFGNTLIRNCRLSPNKSGQILPRKSNRRCLFRNFRRSRESDSILKYVRAPILFLVKQKQRLSGLVSSTGSRDPHRVLFGMI
jgi:hypothetical protein